MDDGCASFADVTQSLCPLAARLLGWRPGEFWAATPAELVLSLRDPEHPASPAPPGRDLIIAMMERDANE